MVPATPPFPQTVPCRVSRTPGAESESTCLDDEMRGPSHRAEQNGIGIKAAKMPLRARRHDSGLGDRKCAALTPEASYGDFLTRKMGRCRNDKRRTSGFVVLAAAFVSTMFQRMDHCLV